MNVIAVILILALKGCYVLGNTTEAKEQCEKFITECSTTTEEENPVCGSDGVTYASKCQVISRQCSGEEIFIKHTAPCPDTSPCFWAKATARPGARPDCRPDGTYAPIQCHTGTGYCWCVTPQGRPLLDTSVKNKKPRCSRLSTYLLTSSVSDGVSTRNGQKRRSPEKQKRQYTSRHRNTCDRAEQARFYSNLIDTFNIEYMRTNHSNDGIKNVERVLSWKFMTLDSDNDGYLDRDEYKELRRLAKKAVRPKKCARTFAKTCDFDKDLKLSRNEWGACMVNDFSRLKGNPAPVHTRPTFNDDPPEANDESDGNDCISDRRSVMEDQKQMQLYIPQCTPDGRYHKVQCYAGYCWCVYQDTGKPIPGTSSKDKTPNCNPVPSPSRPMKGCPEAKKQIFLKALMNQMEKMMKTANTELVETTDKWPTSKEERVATWYFVMLDKNKNKVMERREWKNFRTMVANNRNLKKCGKKLPRYCDINNDRRISMTEWLNCINTPRQNTETKPEESATMTPRRMGPNPLDAFLNDDE